MKYVLWFYSGNPGGTLALNVDDAQNKFFELNEFLDFFEGKEGHKIISVLNYQTNRKIIMVGSKIVI